MGVSAATAGWIAAGLAAASAGTQYVNTEHTASRQDQAAAQAIRNQGQLQKKANADVNKAVAKVADSNSADARNGRLNDYMTQLRKNRSQVQAGSEPIIGSQTFRTDAAQAGNDANKYAATTAGLMASMDAPQIQRRNEGFDYGRLATDLALVGRQSRGQNFLDQLRLRNIRRNPELDLASGLMSAAAGGFAGGAYTKPNGQVVNGINDVNANTMAGYDPRTVRRARYLA